MKTTTATTPGVGQSTPIPTVLMTPEVGVLLPTMTILSTLTMLLAANTAMTTAIRAATAANTIRMDDPIILLVDKVGKVGGATVMTTAPEQATETVKV